VSRLVLSGHLTPAGVAELCARMRAAIEDDGGDVLVCDVGALTHPDAGTVEALARLQLGARRLGRRIRLRDPSCELCELVELFGLTDVLPGEGALRREPLGEPEEREQPLGVEERVEMGDPPV
jgi:ABC-type transporter Mla MlaB component